MSGHGHVVPNPDGSKAGCGGPFICPDCAREKATMSIDETQSQKPSERQAIAEQFSRRHPGTIAILRQFALGHLPASLRSISLASQELAFEMADRLPDGPELTAGLRKLLEAKDCFVRAAVDGIDNA